MFKKILITILGLILVPTILIAEEVSFVWTASTDDITAGYKLYQNGSTVLLATIDDKQVGSITMDVTMVQGCNSFFLVGFGKDGFGNNIDSSVSSIAIWCPPRVIVPIVIGFDAAKN